MDKNIKSCACHFSALKRSNETGLLYNSAASRDTGAVLSKIDTQLFLT